MHQNRRTYLKLLGTLGLAFLAGCSARGTPPAQADDVYVSIEPDYKGWFDDVSNYHRTVDRRGETEVHVAVGTSGSSGYYKFDPPAVAISPGTTVVWEWTGRGGTHNVVAESGAFDSGDLIDAQGHTFEHSFEEPGVYKYSCEPHRAMGMKGAMFVALGDPET